MNYVFGKFSSDSITPEIAREIIKCSHQKLDELKDIDIEEIFTILEDLHKLWSDDNYVRRKRLKKVLPRELGFSDEMVELGLSRIALILQPDFLMKKIETELGNIPRNRGFKVQANSTTVLQWQPLGTVFHVLAGNGFLGALSSLLEGLLTHNINILKLASGKTSFITEFLESIGEVDPKCILADKICALEVPSSDTETISEFKKASDAIVVWGGEQAIQAYRSELPARTRIICFGPKLSFGVVTKKGIDQIGLHQICERIAIEVATWDQSACTAPQFLYLEDTVDPVEFSKELEKALEKMAVELPPGLAPFQTAVEIQKWRSLALVEEGLGQSQVFMSKNSLDYTIITSKDISLTPSPLHRTLKLISYRNFDDVCQEIHKLNGYIQTVGLTCSDSEIPRISQQLVNAGALRVLDLGKMSFGEVDDPHDGAYDLPQFMKLCHFRFDSMANDNNINDFIAKEQREEIIDLKMKSLGHKIKRHSLASKFNSLEQDLSLSNLQRFPIQEKPMSGGDHSRSGYVTRSGGTTGDPKFSVFSKEEWNIMIDRSVSLFKSIGIRPGDRIANCLSAGDLYGGFVSFDHINAKLDTLCFNFTTTHDVESFVNTWRKFRFNVIQGIPSFVVPLIKEAKKIEPAFNFKTFVYGGSSLSPSEIKELKTDFGVERVSGVYGANDGGPIGFQCEYLEPNQYHIVSDYNFIEIHSDQDHSIGELLLTALEKPDNPLIRYRIGDVGTLHDQACKCGRTQPILNLLGRTSEFIHLETKKVHIHQVRILLQELCYTDFQLRRLDDRFTLLVETDDLSQNTSTIQNSLDLLLDSNVAIELTEIGSIPRKPRSTKVACYINEDSN